jgi:hypothetical protein
MKKYIFLTLLFAISALSLFKVNDVFAIISCTQSGSTTYCSNTSTGKTTTYNQYGNNIYGSDGSSYSIYGDTTYGSGNVFNTGGNSGSSLPPLSTSGADMDSPEMKEAEAKRQKACAPSGNPNEFILNNWQCRDATVEWLQALSTSKKNNASSSNDTSENDYSSDSTSRDKDLEEFMEEMLSKIDNTKNGDDLAGYSCSDKNSYVKSKTECACKDGYILNTKNECSPIQVVNQEYCSTFGSKVFYNSTDNNCQCSSGYLVDENNKCVFMATYCADKYGANIHQQGDKCVCNEGYYFDNNVNICKKEMNTETSITKPQNQDISVQNNEAEKTIEVQPVKEVKWYKKMFDWFF